MSSTKTEQLTEEQEKFLRDLEEEFRHRYTENDEEFKAALNERLPPPPVVENWGTSRQRHDRFDNSGIDRRRSPNVRSYRPCDRPRDSYYSDYNDRYAYPSRQEHRYKM